MQTIASGRKNAILTIGFWFLICLFAAAAACIYFVGRKNILAYAGRTKPYSMAMVNFYSEDLADPDTRKVICFWDSLAYFPPDMFPHKGDPETHLHKLIQKHLTPALQEQEIHFSQWAFMGAAMEDYYCLYYKAEEYSPELILAPINWRRFGPKALRNVNPQLAALAPLRTELPPGYTDPIRSRGITFFRQARYMLTLELPLYPDGIKNWTTELKTKYILVNRQGNEEREKGNSEAEEIFTDTAEIFTPARPGSTSMDRMFGDLFARVSQTDSYPTQAMPKEEYPMKVEKTNIAFRDLEAMAKIVSQHETPVLFVIWPVDKERLASEGKWDQASFDDSKRLIQEATSLPNCYLADLSEILGSEHFADRRGHCKLSGRQIIARRLASRVSAILDNRTSQERSIR